jgi:phenylalanyl-tRNA synthetase beta chain
MICELAGGEMAEGVIDVWTDPFEPAELALRPERTAKLLGIDIDPNEQEQILGRLGLEPRSEGERIVCTIPPFRRDLTREADLIEEVARLHGYGKIEPGSEVTHRVIAQGAQERMRREVISSLSSAGYSEAITFSFVDGDECRLFGFDDTVMVDRTVRKSENALRPTLLPSLLRAVRSNQDNGNTELSLFEFASVYRPAETPLPEEFLEIGLVTTDSLRMLRGAVEALVDRMCPGQGIEVVESDRPAFEPGISGELILAGEKAGSYGLVSGNVRDHYGIEKPLAAAVLNFDVMSARAQLVRKAGAVPKFPPIRRDLSLIVDEKVSWRQLQDAIDGVDQPLLAGAEYVTTYRGDPIPKDRKSVTVTLEYRSEKDTLTHDQVDEQEAAVVSALREKLGAELRR